MKSFPWTVRCVLCIVHRGRQGLKKYGTPFSCFSVSVSFEPFEQISSLKATGDIFPLVESPLFLELSRLNTRLLNQGSIQLYIFDLEFCKSKFKPSFLRNNLLILIHQRLLNYCHHVKRYLIFFAISPVQWQFYWPKQQEVIFHLVKVDDQTSCFSKLPAKSCPSICQTTISFCHFLSTKIFWKLVLASKLFSMDSHKKVQFGWIFHDIQT